MLRCLKDLQQYTVATADHELGAVVDLLLDDEKWTVRYLVVGVEGNQPDLRFLITPDSFRTVDWATRRFHLALTMAEVKLSPSVNTDIPVSRQRELASYSYFGFALSWEREARAIAGELPEVSDREGDNARRVAEASGPADLHLRSTRELLNYHIRGTDDTIGIVQNFIVDDETWRVRYLVVDTSFWWIGKSVLIPPRWASSISWDTRTITLNMTRQAIQDSPEWNPAAPINREYELRLYDYHGRPVDWDSTLPIPTASPEARPEPSSLAPPA